MNTKVGTIILPFLKLILITHCEKLIFSFNFPKVNRMCVLKFISFSTPSLMNKSLNSILLVVNMRNFFESSITSRQFFPVSVIKNC